MIRVTIDLIPSGQMDKRKSLYHIDIINDGTGTKGVGKYKYQIVEHDDIGGGFTHYIPIVDGIDVKHRRKDIVFKLINKVLKNVIKLNKI